MNSPGSCRGSTLKVRRFGRYDRNCPSESAVNGPMRMTSDSVGSPPGCTTVARYFATWPLAVISRWISIHKRSSSAAVGVARALENCRNHSSRGSSPAAAGNCVVISDCCRIDEVSFADCRARPNSSANPSAAALSRSSVFRLLIRSSFAW